MQEAPRQDRGLEKRGSRAMSATIIHHSCEQQPPKTIASTKPGDHHSFNLKDEVKSWGDNLAVATAMRDFLEDCLRGYHEDGDTIITDSALKRTSTLVRRFVFLGHPNIKPVATSNSDGGATIMATIADVSRTLSVVIEPGGKSARGAKYEGNSRTLFDGESDDAVLEALIWLRQGTNASA